MGLADHRFDIVDKATFRSGMSRLGAAVNVVTTRSGGARYGFTASAVCSVSDTPATLLVCINRASSCFHAFGSARHFCVNTLMPGQEDLSDLFGGRTASADRFSLGEWTDGLTGVPVLANASVSFECELTNAVSGTQKQPNIRKILHKKEVVPRDGLRRILKNINEIRHKEVARRLVV